MADVYETDPVNGWVWGNGAEFTPELQLELRAMLVRNKKAFAYSLLDLPGYSGSCGDYTIPLTHDRPILSGARRPSAVEKAILDEKCGELLAAGLIELSDSVKYLSQMTMPCKRCPRTGEIVSRRACLDSRKINEATIPDKHGMSLPEDLFLKVGAATCFTKIDLRAGFHQVRLAECDKDKTTFQWGLKRYRFRVLPFGMVSATAFFSRAVLTCTMEAGLEHCCDSFVDDLLVHSSCPAQHIKDVEAVLVMLYANGWRAHPLKTVCGGSHVEYLGFLLSRYGMTPTMAKVAAIRAMRSPLNVSELKSVLGVLGFYRGFLPQYSTICQPLNALTGKDVVWEWGPVQETALQALKDGLCTEGRALKRLDLSLPVIVYTDWSALGIGAILAQAGADKQEYMCVCLSRSLNKHEKNYCSYKGEMLAAVWAIKMMRCYLHGVHFTLVTDHQPLCWLMSCNTLVGQYARWALSLQDYSFTTIHRPGKQHINADALSRMPLESSSDVTGARMDEEEEGTQACLLTSLHDSRHRMEQLHSLHHMSSANTAMYGTIDSDDRSALTEGSNGWLFEAHGTPNDRGVDDTCIGLQQMVYNWHALRKNKSRPAWQGDGAKGGPLDTSTLPPGHSLQWQQHGMVLVELFAGLCAGLEMVLRNGIAVTQYKYVDLDADCREVAVRRMRELHSRYPHLLSMHALEAAFSLPQDVTAMTCRHVESLVASTGGAHYLLVAGWECQDLSPAGGGTGLEGPRSRTYHDMCRVMSWLQAHLPPCHLAYILENTAMQHNWRTPVPVHDFEVICQTFGSPVCIDAAQLGSYAHRLRNFWSNIAPAPYVQEMLEAVVRSPLMRVDNVLDPNVRCQVARHAEHSPYYPSNVAGESLHCLPTLVASPHSYAFRECGLGVVYDYSTESRREPNVEERERALGYTTGCTAAPGVSLSARHRITGGCMDRYCMESYLATCLILSATEPLDPKDKYGGLYQGRVSTLPMAPPTQKTHGSSALVTQESATVGAPADGEPTEKLDIWEDQSTLHYLEFGKHKEGTADTDQRRAQRRRKLYVLRDGILSRIMADGTPRQVPKPGERVPLVQEMHVQAGHWGVYRTECLLTTHYWWHNLRKTVHNVVTTCGVCDRVRVSFNARQVELCPLSIEGLFYRWGVDLCGPFQPGTLRGNLYIMVCIEHFSKHLILIPMPDKAAYTCACAFRQHVFGQFGACAEVVTDQGTEFQGEFQDFLYAARVDHRHTSPNHPQADGLAERAVQSTKNAIRKHIEDRQRTDQWDDALPHIQLGYNASKQRSTGYAPFFLLYGKHAVVPPSTFRRFEEPIDFDNLEQSSDMLLERAKAVQQAGILAGEALKVAQHRDTLRYAKVRGGAYHPKVRRFEVDDFVYLRRGSNRTSLDIEARPEILRVIAIGEQGTLTLQGRCGTTMQANVVNCAPCHLPDIDDTVNPAFAKPPIEHPCQGCGFPDDAHIMLLCDTCGAGWHYTCLSPPLSRVPDGVWQCPDCIFRRIPIPEVVVRSYQFKAAPVRTEKQLAAGRLYNGRLVQASFPCDKTHLPKLFWGVVEYRPDAKVKSFRVLFEDSDYGDYTLRELRPLLMPEGTQWPKGHKRGVAAVLLTTAVYTRPHEHHAHARVDLSVLYPELPHRLKQLQEHVMPGSDKIMCPPSAAVPDMRPQLRCLSHAVDFGLVHQVHDPCGGNNIREVASALLQRNMGGDWHPDGANCCEAGFYRQVGLADAIVTAPRHHHDLIVGLCDWYPHAISCVSVPVTYVTRAAGARKAWLGQVKTQGRLAFAEQDLASGEQCLWLLLFPTPEMRSRMMLSETPKLWYI